MSQKNLSIVSLVINIALIAYVTGFLLADKGEFIPGDVEHVSASYKKPFNAEHIGKLKKLIDNGSVLVVDSKSRVLLDYNSGEKMIPASTLKTITSLAALRYLGEDFRFKTDFKLDARNNLYIKGYGDPHLISEEIEVICQNLKKKGLKEIRSIYLDGSYFNGYIMVPGIEDTYESYDARNSALAANFNTIAFKRTWNGLRTGEPATPLIGYSKVILKKAEREDVKLKSKRNVRISIKDERDSLLYFGYLFKELCKRASIKVTGRVLVGKSPSSLALYYRHKSSKKLSEVVKNLLEFSNNFTANQILLVMGAKSVKGPATLKSGLEVLTGYVQNVLKLDDIRVTEGSGISYANKVSARQMIVVVEQFKPYKNLLKEVQEKVFAKSGGLKTVNSLVGFIDSPRNGELKFAIILNQSTNNKPQLLKIITETLF